MKTWYNDTESKIVYDIIKNDLSDMVDKVFKGLELSHIGLNRNMETGEVILKLHLNEVGKIKVKPFNDSNSILFKG